MVASSTALAMQSALIGGGAWAVVFVLSTLMVRATIARAKRKVQAPSLPALSAAQRPGDRGGGRSGATGSLPEPRGTRRRANGTAGAHDRADGYLIPAIAAARVVAGGELEPGPGRSG